MACEGGYLEVVRTLLFHGAQINEKDDNGFTPLHKACVRGSAEAVRILLEQGHPIDERGKYGQTPLHLACEGGNAAVVAVLLEYNHPVNVKDCFHSTPLHIACYKGNVEMVEILLMYGAYADEKDERDRTPLHKACNGGNLDVVKILLQHGAQLKGRSGHRYQSPLHRACGSLNLVKFLLQLGVSVTEKDSLGQTPLHAACMWGDVDVVRALLEHGAPVNAVADGLRLTPLHKACMAGKVDVVQVLLENGANIDALDSDKNTALNSDISLIPAEVITVLLDYNAGTRVMCSCYRCKRRRTVIACQYTLQRQERKFSLVHAYERHFIKCKAAGLHLNGFNHVDPASSLDWNNDETSFSQFRVDCLTELDRMKKEKVDNSNVSYFGVLRQNLPALRNYRFMKTSPEKLREKFPIYGNMIYCSFLNLPKRSFLIDQSNTFLEWSDLPRLPPECVMEVQNYLSDEDLLRILEACKPLFLDTRHPGKKNEKKSRCMVRRIRRKMVEPRTANVPQLSRLVAWKTCVVKPKMADRGIDVIEILCVRFQRCCHPRERGGVKFCSLYVTNMDSQTVQVRWFRRLISLLLHPRLGTTSIATSDTDKSASGK